MRLSDRVAIVTGGGAGIGEAISKGLAAEGAAVAVFEVDEARGNGVVNEINSSGGRAIFCKADVSSSADVEAAMQRTVAELGQPDILVNNAAVQLIGHDARAH